MHLLYREFISLAEGSQCYLVRNIMINQLVSVSGEVLYEKLRAQHVQARLICHPTIRASRERASGVNNSKEGAFGPHLLLPFVKDRFASW